MMWEGELDEDEYVNYNVAELAGAIGIPGKVERRYIDAEDTAEHRGVMRRAGSKPCCIHYGGQA